MLNLPKPPAAIDVRTPADWSKAQNAILMRMENVYRQTAYDGISSATKGFKDGTDFAVIVNGRKTGLAGIRSAKLFKSRGIELRWTVRGKAKALREATRRVFDTLRGYNFSEKSTGNWRSQLEVVIDDKHYADVPPIAAFENAVQVFVWSKARYSSPLDAAKNYGLFGAAARAGNTQGIIADVGYLTQAEATALGQQRSNRWKQLPSPAVFIATAENAANVRRTSTRTIERRARRARRARR